MFRLVSIGEEGVSELAYLMNQFEHFKLDVIAGAFDPAKYEAERFDFVTLDQVIEHLSEIRGATPEEVAETLLQAATDYAGGCLQDDAAILVLDYEE